MDKKMQIFESEQFGKLRAISIDGEPWIAGKDVASILGYERPNKAVVDHIDSDDRQMLDKKTQSHFGIELGQRGGWIINESGLYTLILSSKLDSAKQFKRWVTSEVLPSIRKHGAYLSDELLRQAAINSDVAAQVAKALLEEKGKRSHLEGQLRASEGQLAIAKPKAEYYDALVDASCCTGIRVTAKELGVSQSAFTSHLIRRKYAYYDRSGRMQPYALHYRNGLFVVKEGVAPNGAAYTQMLVTPKGKFVLLSELQEMAG